MQQDTATLEAMRQSFKVMNKYAMVPMWKLGLGKLINAWPDGMGRIMVLVHTGRKSGTVYQTPVNYTVIDGDVYCTAGFGQNTQWYKNIMVNNRIEVWLPDGWWVGEAHDVTETDPEALAKLREVLIASGFAAYAFGDMDPRSDPDDVLAEKTAEYRLLRIRRVEARTGRGGPGEFDWVWPTLAMLFGFLLLIRPRRR